MFVQPKNPKGYQTLKKKKRLFVILTVQVSSCEVCDCAHLTIIGYSTKELKLQVKATRISTEQPPQTAGNVLK